MSICDGIKATGSMCGGRTSSGTDGILGAQLSHTHGLHPGAESRRTECTGGRVWGQVGGMWGPDTAIYMYGESVSIIGPLLLDVKCRSHDA